MTESFLTIFKVFFILIDSRTVAASSLMATLLQDLDLMALHPSHCLKPLKPSFAS